MYIYQGYYLISGTSTTPSNIYLWFDCIGGGWTISTVPSGSCGVSGYFACSAPAFYGIGDVTLPNGWTSCPGSDSSCLPLSSPPPPRPPPPPSPAPPAPAGSSSLCQAPVTSFCCYDGEGPAYPRNYVCPATTSCGRGVCVPATNQLCGCSGQNNCPATSTCCGSTCCPLFSYCGGDANSCACSSNAFPKPRDDLRCGSTPADVELAAMSPGYIPGAGSCGSSLSSVLPSDNSTIIAVSVVCVILAIGLLAGVGVLAWKRRRGGGGRLLGGLQMREVTAVRLP